MLNLLLGVTFTVMLTLTVRVARADAHRFGVHPLRRLTREELDQEPDL